MVGEGENFGLGSAMNDVVTSEASHLTSLPLNERHLPLAATQQLAFLGFSFLL